MSVSSWFIFPAISAYEDSGIRAQAGVYGGMQKVLEAFTKHAFTNEYLPQQEHGLHLQWAGNQEKKKDILAQQMSGE